MKKDDKMTEETLGNDLGWKFAQGSDFDCDIKITILRCMAIQATQDMTSMSSACKFSRDCKPAIKPKLTQSLSDAYTQMRTPGNERMPKS